MASFDADHVQLLEKGRDAVLAMVPQGYGMTADEAMVYAGAVLASISASGYILLHRSILVDPREFEEGLDAFQKG